MATQSSGVRGRSEDGGGQKRKRAVAAARTIRYAGGADELASFKVGAVRYIKLGEGGKWARAAIAEGILPFGFAP
ncbi:hypothetical protein [Bradyrhizobium elkanii]|uniref:hypothetical protein n=1 Tax=Bradyrhizobium elkanii TaxID=29448 RepID=UPI001AE3CFB6|nr:hypothetical protein [Bradyrhizobium elkanii]MBP2427610.1 hypothetical protein [Bradyrhizobium elkanii]WLA96131.1 hypothetical protein QNJ96_16140 [Bradyrhizobium elkanii]